jgi:hypothetical protein
MSSKLFRCGALLAALTLSGAAFADNSSGNSSQTGGTSEKTPGATENMNPKGTDADAKTVMNKHSNGAATTGAGTGDSPGTAGMGTGNGNSPGAAGAGNGNSAAGAGAGSGSGK